MAANKKSNPELFWKQYEADLGEKVLAYTLGQYLSGWAAFEPPLWGLLIATSGGFRFHHFPHENWLLTVTRIGRGDEAPKEKTLFIPHERILAVELRREKSLLKRIFVGNQSHLVLRYQDTEGGAGEFVAETDAKAALIVKELQAELKST
ncbi:hypothetical protein ACYULU_15480 [Breznakiellaceae bacterium SP9]